jgi:hypothetical protein
MGQPRHFDTIAEEHEPADLEKNLDSTMNDHRLTLQEHPVVCPHCGERISMVLDLSAGSQSYFEDCEVCCNPIEVVFEVEDGAIVSFRADIS